MKPKTRQFQDRILTMEDVPPKGEITICYLRVSTDAQAEKGYGLAEQQSKLSAYCVMQDIVPYFFIDDGFTGTNTERPAFLRMRELVLKKRVNKIIVYRIDRLGRSLRDVVDFIEDCKNVGRRTDNDGKEIPFTVVVSATESFSSGDNMGIAMLSILAIFAQLDHDNIIEKTKSGRMKRVQDGKFPGGGLVPFGYKYDKNLGRLVVVPEDAEKVRKVFEMYVGGNSPDRIAKILGFRSDVIVRSILRHKVHCGYLEYNKQTFKGEHEPIISEELFFRAQERMKERSSVRGKSEYLLAGKLVCGVCGAKMRYQKWGNGLKIYCYSQQSSKTHLIKNPDCDNRKYNAEEIEESVIDVLLKIHVSYEKAKEKIEGINVLSELEKRLGNETRVLKNMYSRQARNTQSDEALESLILEQQKLVSDIKMAISEERTSGKIRERANEAHEMLKTLPAAWKQMDFSERKRVVERLIDTVTLTDDNISIRFRFEDYLEN